MSDPLQLEAMTPLQLAQRLLADVTAYRDDLLAQAALLDEPDVPADEQARIERNKASLEVAIAGANDQIVTFTQRVDQLAAQPA